QAASVSCWKDCPMASFRLTKAVSHTKCCTARNRSTATLARLACATKISRPMRGCSPSLASLESQRHLQIVELANELRHPTAAGLFLDPAQMRVDGIQTQLARVGIFAERDAGLQGLRERRLRLREAEYVTQGRRRGGIVAARV